MPFETGTRDIHCGYLNVPPARRTDLQPPEGRDITMSKTLPAFSPVAGFEHVWCVQSGSLRCTALQLNTGELCVYSPVAGLGAEARDSLAGLGEVKFLLAPNHYHNKGLGEYAAAFPSASLCCSDAARPRLRKIVGLTFDSLDALASRMPSGASLRQPEGLKTGEVWLELTGKGDVAWVVADAFSGPKSKKVETKLQMLGTFPKYGVEDAGKYCTWLEGALSASSPTLILPCHGSSVRAPDLDQQARSLVKSNLAGN